MSSVQTYDIYSQCQQFLTDFGFTQDGDKFTYHQPETGSMWFEFPQVVTAESIKLLCHTIVETLDDISDEESPELSSHQASQFYTFVSSIQGLFKGDDYSSIVKYKIIAGQSQEIKELKAALNRE